METKTRKILLVEDNPGDVRLAEMAFREYAPGEFALHEVGCIQNAMERLSKETFDVILLDLYLPDAFGLEPLSRIHVIHPQIPIIALTGLLTEGTAQYATHMGAKSYFCKNSLSWEKVIRTVRRLADRRSDGSREPVGKK
ncbi:MAG TPA: response regulator [bacterium]|jgi:DNA-binding NtrC family response regulator|nr:response regulator [bacterium]